jgi:hypothetical protein
MTLRQLFGLIFLVALYIKLFDLCWWFMEPPATHWKNLDQIILSCVVYLVVGLYALIIECGIIGLFKL